GGADRGRCDGVDAAGEIADRPADRPQLAPPALAGAGDARSAGVHGRTRRRRPGAARNHAGGSGAHRARARATAAAACVPVLGLRTAGGGPGEADGVLAFLVAALVGPVVSNRSSART